MRNNHATWRDPVNRISVAGQPDVRTKVVSKIGTVGEIKHLEDHSDIRAFFDLEVLGYTRVELNVGLTTKVIERCL